MFKDENRHYSLRKLSVGLASVLIGISFASTTGSSVKADTVESGSNSVQTVVKGSDAAAKIDAKDNANLTESNTESAFESIDSNFDFSNILCIKEKRKILAGCVFSYSNNYYQLLDENGVIVEIFKGTDITVMEDIFDHTIRAEYRKKVYSTRQIAGHRQDPLKRQQKIQNQKELDEYLRLQNLNN